MALDALAYRQVKRRRIDLGPARREPGLDRRCGGIVDDEIFHQIAEIRSLSLEFDPIGSRCGKAMSPQSSGRFARQPQRPAEIATDAAAARDKTIFMSSPLDIAHQSLAEQRQTSF